MNNLWTVYTALNLEQAIKHQNLTIQQANLLTLFTIKAQVPPKL